MDEQKENLDNERVVVFQRLTQKKDKILAATCEIEDLRKKYINQNRLDNDGTIESEIYKRLYTIIACFSELVAFSGGRGNSLLITLVHYAMENRLSGSKFVRQPAGNKATEFHIADSIVLDAMSATVNSLMVTWSFKREPMVSIGQLESILQVFKLPRQ